MRKPNLGQKEFLTEGLDKVLKFQEFLKRNISSYAREDPLYTGRFFVIPKEGNIDNTKSMELFETKLGMKTANSRDFLFEGFSEDKIEEAEAFVYDEIGIALVGGNEDQIKILENDSITGDYILVPERVVHVPEDLTVNTMGLSTWGLKTTEVEFSQYTGRNIKIAVLDTGFDDRHPDFSGRSIELNSYVDNENYMDQHGHGTHCIGTACGSVDINGMRYGVASSSNIFVGKVLSNKGSGAQSWIINGMVGATNAESKVISMSLGSKVFPGEGYDIAYERAAQYALSRGTIVVAASGNDSYRVLNQFWPVGSPANCPSILAVASLDSKLDVSNFSNRSINTNGQIDVAAPGEEIYSSWPMPIRYNTISGTSMATPHVAGILGLLWEKFPNETPYKIITELRNLARRLPLPSIDIGDGLCIAPR